ncbi:hypothetical protein AB6A40_000782 [Gnathostoma spinigerum]|uniref:GDNF/GAS1 domain-containing protein n=1 Tax=Gnathostoma spinigerum TaxID=75299 RepID=A0ABD6E2V5_9BILA
MNTSNIPLLHALLLLYVEFPRSHVAAGDIDDHHQFSRHHPLRWQCFTVSVIHSMLSECPQATIVRLCGANVSCVSCREMLKKQRCVLLTDDAMDTRSVETELDIHSSFEVSDALRRTEKRLLFESRSHRSRRAPMSENIRIWRRRLSGDLQDYRRISSISCDQALYEVCLKHVSCRQLWMIFRSACAVDESNQCHMTNREDCWHSFEGLSWTGLGDCRCMNGNSDCQWIKLQTTYNKCIYEIAASGIYPTPVSFLSRTWSPKTWDHKSWRLTEIHKQQHANITVPFNQRTLTQPAESPLRTPVNFAGKSTEDSNLSVPLGLSTGTSSTAAPELSLRKSTSLNSSWNGMEISDATKTKKAESQSTNLQTEASTFVAKAPEDSKRSEVGYRKTSSSWIGAKTDSRPSSTKLSRQFQSRRTTIKPTLTAPSSSVIQMPLSVTMTSTASQRRHKVPSEFPNKADEVPLFLTSNENSSAIHKLWSHQNGEFKDAQVFPSRISENFSRNHDRGLQHSKNKEFRTLPSVDVRKPSKEGATWLAKSSEKLLASSKTTNISEKNSVRTNTSSQIRTAKMFTPKYSTASTCVSAYQRCERFETCKWHLSELRMRCTNECSREHCVATLQRFVRYVARPLVESLMFCHCNPSDVECLNYQQLMYPLCLYSDANIGLYSCTETVAKCRTNMFCQRYSTLFFDYCPVENDECAISELDHCRQAVMAIRGTYLEYPCYCLANDVTCRKYQAGMLPNNPCIERSMLEYSQFMGEISSSTQSNADRLKKKDGFENNKPNKVEQMTELSDRLTQNHLKTTVLHSANVPLFTTNSHTSNSSKHSDVSSSIERSQPYSTMKPPHKIEMKQRRPTADGRGDLFLPTAAPLSKNETHNKEFSHIEVDDRTTKSHNISAITTSEPTVSESVAVRESVTDSYDVNARMRESKNELIMSSDESVSFNESSLMSTGDRVVIENGEKLLKKKKIEMKPDEIAPANVDNNTMRRDDFGAVISEDKDTSETSDDGKVRRKGEELTPKFGELSLENVAPYSTDIADNIETPKESVDVLAEAVSLQSDKDALTSKTPHSDYDANIGGSVLRRVASTTEPTAHIALPHRTTLVLPPTEETDSADIKEVGEKMEKVRINIPQRSNTNGRLRETYVNRTETLTNYRLKDHANDDRHYEREEIMENFDDNENIVTSPKIIETSIMIPSVDDVPLIVNHSYIEQKSSDREEFRRHKLNVTGMASSSRYVIEGTSKQNSKTRPKETSNLYYSRLIPPTLSKHLRSDSTDGCTVKDMNGIMITHLKGSIIRRFHDWAGRCSSWCICNKDRQLNCVKLPCLASGDCKTSLTKIEYGGKLFIKDRGACTCQSSKFICDRPKKMPTIYSGLYLTIGYSRDEVMMIKNAVPRNILERAGFLLADESVAHDIGSRLQFALDTFMPNIPCRLVPMANVDFGEENVIYQIEWFGVNRFTNETNEGWHTGQSAKVCSPYVKQLADHMTRNQVLRYQLVLSTIKQISVIDLLDALPARAPRISLNNFDVFLFTLFSLSSVIFSYCI